MLAKRIIPCLDIKDGRTVKGVNFVDLKDAGDPVELGKRYCDEGADELVFLDITATHEKRKTLAALAKNIAQHLNIPFTIGGGISSVTDASYLLEAGADKISVNSAAVKNPDLINQLADTFGNQFVVFSMIHDRALYSNDQLQENCESAQLLITFASRHSYGCPGSMVAS